MNNLTKVFYLISLSLVLIGSTCNKFDSELSLKQKSPSYVVKQFWREAQSNDLEQAQLMVSKSGILIENSNGMFGNLQTPIFIKVLSDTNGNIHSIRECDADANIMTQVLLEVEDKSGSKAVFDFILSNQNPNKIWKIAWVSKREPEDTNCGQRN